MESDFQKLLKNYLFKGWIVIDILLLYGLIQYFFYKDSFLLTIRVIKDFFIE
jgi:hypothetical protein